jgi:hypothetical protein
LKVRAELPTRRCARTRSDVLTGHKTRAVFDRYNIVNEQELLTAGQRLADYLTADPAATDRPLNLAMQSTGMRSATTGSTRGVRRAQMLPASAS